MSDLNLLSLITFLPLIAALLLVVFLRGDDEAARLNAKRLALLATSATFLLSLATRRIRAFSSSRTASGSPG